MARVLRLRAGLVLSLITAVLLASLPATFVSGAKGTSKPTLSRQLKDVNYRIKGVQAKLRKAKSEKRSVAAQLNATQRRLEDAQRRVSRNKMEIQRVREKLRIIDARLARTQRKLDRRANLLSERLADIYEGQDIGYLEVLLGSENMRTFLSRSYYVKEIVSSDVELIEEIKKDREQIERDKKVQAAEELRLVKIQDQLVRDRDGVADLAAQKYAELQAIEQDRELLEGMLDELAAESERIESKILQYQQSRRSSNSYNQTFSGGLSMPVSGRITSRFGYRVHPITHVRSLHTGVDIACPTGTPIKAAAAGEVIGAGWMGAYGYAVIIDHGGGISTLYGHNSKLLVRVGQKVSKGQTIAKAGSTGYSTGSHCHFEKRVNGKPVNPL